MLFRLSDPFLWRSLKVANGNARANALALLLEIFPLRDPDFLAPEQDDLLSKQCTIIKAKFLLNF